MENWIQPLEKSKFEYDTDIVEFKHIQFSVPVFNSRKDTPNLQNITFDEMSESKKLHWALTKVHLENRSGISSWVRFKLDTKASGNLSPVSVYNELFPDCNMKDLGKTIDRSVQFLTSTKSSIKQLGTVCFRVYHSQCNFQYTCLFFVVPNKCKPILGLPDLMWLNLVNFNCRVSDSWDDDHTSFAFDCCEEKTGTFLNKETLVHGPRFKSIFLGVGIFPVEPMNIQLSDDAVLIQKAARHVPMSLKDKFEQEIHSLEKQGIISKLDYNQATEWLNSFFVVKKPNSDHRICLDPTDLNKYIVRPVYNSNTLDEVSFKLKDTKFFSVFDATHGFFHLLLNEKSKLLTRMLRPIGVDAFNVLTMGLSNSNDLFESALRELLQDLKGMVNITDDVLVFRSTQQEHNSNMITFLERCLEVDLKLNLSKIGLNCTEVPFWDNVFQLKE